MLVLDDKSDFSVDPIKVTVLFWFKAYPISKVPFVFTNEVSCLKIEKLPFKFILVLKMYVELKFNANDEFFFWLFSQWILNDSPLFKMLFKFKSK